MKTTINWRKLILELLVVFLGVTSGFLMNNWRANRAEVRLEQKYLVGFLKDTEVNIEELQGFITVDSLWLERAMPLMSSLQEDNFSEDSATAVLSIITTISKISKTTGTWNDITNSGNLNLIRNFTLKQEIVDYYMQIEGVIFIEDYFYQYFSDFVMPFVISEISILKGELRDPNIGSSMEFSNVFAGYISMVQQRYAAYKNLLEKSYALRDNLDNFIQK